MASTSPTVSNRIKEGNPSVRAVKYTSEIHSETKMKLRRCEIGVAKKDAEEKVILLVGETGAGKTTMINSFLNYLYQVKWDDDYRLELLYDEDEESLRCYNKMARLTDWVSAYVFNDTPDNMPYKVTIIDTPGYECDKCETRDQHITSQIQQLFSDNETCGISHIDAVAIVIKDSTNRITDRQNRIFQSILSLFGNDVFNIFAFATFGNLVGQSHAAAALAACDVPVKDCFVLDNNVLYATKDGTTTGVQMFLKLNWDKRLESFQKFFEKLQDITPNDLITTTTVLEKRETLGIIIAGIPCLLKSYLIQMKKLEVEEIALLGLEDSVAKNEGYQYEVFEENVVKVRNPEDLMARVCRRCQTTCHYPCNHPTRLFCSAMRWLALFRGCDVCAKNCGISYHVKRNYRYKRLVERKFVTKKDIKEKYKIAVENKKEKEKAVQKNKKQKELLWNRINEKIENAKECIREIKELSLRPDSYTIFTYLEELMTEESKEQDVGWKDRVEVLRALCKKEDE